MYEKYLYAMQYDEFINIILLGMPSSGMLHRVALVRTDVSEESSTSIIRAAEIAACIDCWLLLTS
jgi:hypothetical protein